MMDQNTVSNIDIEEQLEDSHTAMDQNTVSNIDLDEPKPD